MFKEVVVHAHFNERTGYGIHASRFFPLLDELVRKSNGTGTVHISLLDTVSACHVKDRWPAPSILYNVWESTEQPQEFIDNLKLYDQLWVPSEWQKAASIAQGIPEEFIRVVPEGVDPETYKPKKVEYSLEDPLGIRSELNLPADPFTFVHVGQWQPRKSTEEIIRAFKKAFPLLPEGFVLYGTDVKDTHLPNVRLQLSVDTLFPSDEYKSTEERLKAYGLEDPRIEVVHFEERPDYIKRLQNAHCFISCSRSEGWGLPFIESMACGIPTIVADWGGSTEYAYDAIKVRVPVERKPFGIYGGWDVPGKWGEPDYEHLATLIKDVYENYAQHKEAALKNAEMIRTKFSWQAAAEKAYAVLEELWQKQPNPAFDVSRETSVKQPNKVANSPENLIREYAAKLGFDVTLKKRETAIFAVNCFPNSQEKLETLVETIKQIKSFNYPVLLVSHYALPASVIEMADFYLYEKEDILSGDDKPVYWRRHADGRTESKEATYQYHGVAANNDFRNAIDFCRGRYDWIYSMNSDCEVDLNDWLKLVRASDKDIVCPKYEGDKVFNGRCWALRTEVADKYWPRLHSWKEYADKYPELRFCSERWISKHFEDSGFNLDNVDWIDIELTNRFDQVDRDLWPDDIYACHFVGGPIVDISGLSRREYDVSFNVGDKNIYTLRQKVGMWSRPSLKYYLPWEVVVRLNGEEKFRHKLDLEGKRVLISMGSKALGDTIAWMPYVEEFRKKHKCHILCAGWWQEIFDYPEIEFVKPGTVINDLYASYDVGCFDNQPDMNPKDWRTVPLQQVAADILGIEYKPLRAKLKMNNLGLINTPNGKYICFSEFSTMQNKMWNRPGAWQKVVNHLSDLGYAAVSISNESTQLQNVISHNGQSIQQTFADIAGCEFYIGLNHGPAWIAYSLGKPVIMLTGVSEPFNDFPMAARLQVDTCRPGCFNDPSVPIDRDWNWCPKPPGGRKFACTADITEEMVFKAIKKIRSNGHAVKARIKPEGSKRKHRGADGDGQVPAEAGRGDRPGKRKAF